MDRLKAKHRVELRKSGLTLATMGISGCYSISRREAMAVLGRDPRSGGIAFPYSDTYQRIKLDKPYVDSRTGKSAKYLAPKGSSNRLFFWRLELVSGLSWLRWSREVFFSLCGYPASIDVLLKVTHFEQ